MLGIPKLLRGLVKVDTVNMNSQFVTLSSSVTHYIKQLSEKPHFDTVPVIHYPLYGALSTSGFALDVETRGESFESWFMEVQDFMTFDLQGNSTYISSPETSIEPGSWFIVLLPRRFVVSAEGGGNWQFGFPAHHYIEFVLTDDALRAQQLFIDHTTDLGLQHERNQQLSWEGQIKAQFASGSGKQSDIIHNNKTQVCVWGSNTMDGQKRIWLQQIAFMDPARFCFSWILTIGSSTIQEEIAQNRSDTVLFQLLQMHNVHVVDSPFNNYSITPDRTDGFDTSNVTAALQYMRQQFVLAGGDLSRMDCSWCGEPYALVRSLFQQEACDVIVYGNSRGFSTDFFITDVARSLGMRSVMELQNLFPDVSIPPDLIVGPSQYALQHESVV
ncbi:hypothetical protein EON65_48450, partial [archaeon]